MKRIALLFAFALLTLGLVACPAMETDDPDPPAPGKIPAVATGNADLSILVEALTKANLVDALNTDDKLTVFAPTNAAFAALLEELGVTKDELLAREDLADILKYHVVSGEAKAASLTDGQELTTLQGDIVTVAVADGKVSLTDGRERTSNVATADVPAANGVVHVIDKVLLPPAPPAPITVEVSLSGQNEVPPITDNLGSVGSATVTLDGKTLTVEGTYSGFEATMAHIHGPAAAGTNTGKLFDLVFDETVTPKTLTGEVTLTDAQVTEFKNGLYYINVHSGDNPNGEIRGQIVPPAQ